MQKINYYKTFTFTLKFELLKSLFALTIYLNLLIYQLNVNNAWLYDEIYIIISFKYLDIINNKVLR